MNLVTRAEAKTYLNITSVTYDTLLDELISDCSGMIARLCRRDLAAADYEQVYDGSGRKSLILDNAPINEIYVLSDDLDKDNRQYDSTIDLDTIMVRGKSGIIELYNQTFGEGQRNIYVKYNAGFATIPGELKLVCKDLIAKKYTAIIERRAGISSKTVNGESVSFSSQDLNDDQRKVINEFKFRDELQGVDVVFGPGS